jgi:hypothetical protein
VSKLLNSKEAKAFAEADVGGLIPAGKYPVKLVSIDDKENDNTVKVFKLRVAGGEFRGRVLHAWPSTARERIWTLKRLLEHVIDDPATTQVEDLESKHFTAEIGQRKRSDTGELTNDVVRLLPLEDNVFVDDEDDEAKDADDDIPW